MNRTLPVVLAVLVVLASWSLQARISNANAAGKTHSAVGVVENPERVAIRKTPSAPWEALGRNGAVKIGWTIKAVVDGARVRMNDSGAFRLEAGTQIQFQEPQDVPGEKTNLERAERIDMAHGAVSIDIPEAAHHGIFLVAPDDQMVVFHAGKAHVAVDSDGMILAVHAGTARAAGHGLWHPITAGTGMQTKKTGKTVNLTQLGPAPKLATDACVNSADHHCAIAVVEGTHKASVSLRWQPVAEADHYVAMLWGDVSATIELGRVLLPASQTEYKSPLLDVGSYWATVQAFTPGGSESLISAPRALRVARIKVDAGTIFLPSDSVAVYTRGASVTLPDSAGMEFARWLPPFGPVPPTIGCQPGDILFRIAGDPTDMARVTLELRALQASVYLGPATAVWPRDHVVLQAQLLDPSGRIDPQSVVPHIEASINGEAVQANIERHGQYYSCEIPARTDAGPWIVRVDVIHPDGTVLGRGALEVVGPFSQAPKRTLLW